MKNVRYAWSRENTRYNQCQSVQNTRISRKQEEKIGDAMKIDESNEPIKSSPPGTRNRENKPITSTNSYLDIKILHITQNLGETRSSRDSVRRNAMVLNHTDSRNKLGPLTKCGAPVFLFNEDQFPPLKNNNGKQLNSVSSKPETAGCSSKLGELPRQTAGSNLSECPTRLLRHKNFVTCDGTSLLNHPLSGEKQTYYLLLPQLHGGWESSGDDPPNL